MKSMLASKPPKIVADVLNGNISILIFKKFPKDYRGWVYFYVTKDKKLLFDKEQKIYFVGTHNACLERHREDTDIYMDSEYELYCDEKHLTSKVVARFYCDNVEEIKACGGIISKIEPYFIYQYNTKKLSIEELLHHSCLDRQELDNYLNEKTGYAIHISQLEIFDKPKELSEFYPAFYYKGDKPYKDKQTYSLVHKVVINGKFEYERVHCLTKAPSNYMYVDVDAL